MKKQTKYIFLCILIILLCVFFGKKNRYEGLENPEGTTIGTTTNSGQINTTGVDLKDAKIKLDEVKDDRNIVDNENETIKRHIQSKTVIINKTENDIKGVNTQIGELEEKHIKNSYVPAIVNLPLITDANNTAEKLEVNDPSNQMANMQKDINGNTTNLKYMEWGGKKCVYFNNDFNQYLSFPFLNPTQFTFCFWIRIDPDDNNYYTVVSITNKRYWNPSVQVDIQGTSIKVFNSLPNHWNPIHDFNTSKSGWTHILYTYDEKSNYKTCLYVDAKLVSHKNGSGPFMGSDIRYKPNTFIIGRSGDTGRAYRGYVRDFSYYAIPFQLEDVKKMYDYTK